MRLQRFAWMREHCGYADPPGRAQCALDLARAEEYADALGWRLQCETSEDGWATYGALDSCYTAVLYADRPGWNEEPRILAAVGGIDVSDAEAPDYWRVIRAELAQQAIRDHGTAVAGILARRIAGRRVAA